jgi:hypothetical protein
MGDEREKAPHATDDGEPDVEAHRQGQSGLQTEPDEVEDDDKPDVEAHRHGLNP